MTEPSQGAPAPDDPRSAGVPRQSGPTRVYESDDLAVVWDATRCVHVATCLQALPEVFDVRRRPWVDVEGAPDEQIAAAVRRCPTGALKYEPRGEYPAEEPDAVTTVQAGNLGPLYLRGRVRLVDGHGRLIAEETRVALCRCGASAHKPYCDNSHRLVRPQRQVPDQDA
jgi:uncharacterized Fe-S cluster protein YjdI